MLVVAVVRAGERLERARNALDAFSGSSSYSEAEEHWRDFLLAASSIFAKLEQGAKGNGLSQSWFGRQRRFRKTDATLRYLHHARNCDEHGLELVTERRPDGGQKQRFGERTEWTIRTLDEKTGEQGPPVKAWMYGPHVRLAKVIDRGVTYFPPKEVATPTGDPEALGRHALSLLERMLSEAAALPSLSAGNASDDERATP